MRCVFVTVGTTEFDHLLETVCQPEVVDLLGNLGCTKLTLQIGRGKFEPPEKLNRGKIELESYRFKPSIKSDLENADLVISHAGAGTCLETLALGKRLLVVVNETLHDNHQLELAQKFYTEGYLHYCTPASLVDSLKSLDLTELKPYVPGSPENFARWLDTVIKLY